MLATSRRGWAIADQRHAGAGSSKSSRDSDDNAKNLQSRLGGGRLFLRADRLKVVAVVTASKCLDGHRPTADCEHDFARLCWRAKFHDDQVPIKDAGITEVVPVNAMKRCARGVVDEVVVKIQRLVLCGKRRQPSTSGCEH